MEEAAEGNAKLVEEPENDLPQLLFHLRSHYEKIKKEEALMHHQREKWLRSVDEWLAQQEQARPVAVREPPVQREQREQPEQRRQERRPRVVAPGEEDFPAAPDEYAQPQESVKDAPSFSSSWWSSTRGLSFSSPVPVPGVQPPQLGPQKPCPQPKAVELDEPIREATDDQIVKAKPPVMLAVPPEDMNSRISATQAEIEALAQKRRHESNRSRRRESTRLQEQTCLTKLVEHTAFDSCCAIMILFNSAIIGISVNHATDSDQEMKFTFVSGYICNVFFLVELIMRMIVQGRHYFTNENRNWNIFDFSLVSFSVVEFFMEIVGAADETSSVGQSMKTIKMLRIIRVFRMFRFFRELSLMALMIVDSMKPLFWALTMLSIIIYVFAIVFTSRASDYMKKLGNAESESKLASEVERQFGSLMGTVYTLIQAMIGGVSWGVCCDALLSIDTLSGLLFLFYVAFTILAVMNIITGVFVDNAVETARTQRDFLIQKEMELREKYTGEMRDLFAEMDKDGKGTIGLDEVKAYLQDPRVQGYFNALGLETSDTERLFKLIDDDGSGDVDVDEFLDGCLRLKGQARSIDVYAIMHDLKIVENKLDEWHSGEGKELEPLKGETPTILEPPRPQVVTVTTTATATLHH